MPSSPSPAYGQPAPARPSPFGGLMGALGGFALGGLLGGLLFGGLGHGFGIGLLDVLVIGGGLLLLLSLRRRRQAEQPAYATATGDASAYGAGREAVTGGGADVETAAGGSDLARGLAHIRAMDPGFDPQALAEHARKLFADVQDAVVRRDAGAVRDHLTPEMLGVLASQCERLRAARQTNRVEQITVRRAEVSEAWQERGQDFATVYVAASLVDYTVDDASGGVLDGSRSRLQEAEEFWTFTRAVGPHPWKLSAIQAG